MIYTPSALKHLHQATNLGNRMSRTFELFHLSLMQRAQPDLFGDGPQNREDWLSSVLKEKIVFTGRATEYHWIPETCSKIIIGIIVKEVSHSFHLPPEEGGTEKRDTEWQGARVIIDHANHQDGQRLAFEFDTRIGKPSPLLKYLFEYLNSKPNHPYIVDAKPIFDASTFWDFAGQNGNCLRRVTFDFVAPNMWDTTKSLDQELKRARDDTNAQNIRVGFYSPDGISTESDRIKQGVEYSEKGGGEIEALAMSGLRYKSKDKTKKTKIDIQIPNDNTEETRLSWLREAGKILGFG
jgi:hypothetical protein